MKELIKIQSEVIGAKTVNSVDSRDLYRTLKIKKDFADWINHQLNSLGLEENVDYITFKKKSSGGRPTKEYILTLDTGKHISMASRTPRGKEVRNYFIEVEKMLNPQIENINIYEINGRIGGLTSANLRYANKIASLEEQIIELKQMNPFQVTEVRDNCEVFMNDSCLHNNFLEFLYQANKAVHEVNIIRHLSPRLDGTHQSLSNFMLHMTRRYEKIRGMQNYRY